MSNEPTNKVVLQFILLYFIWGFNWVVMKIANDYFLPVFFVAFRFAIGAVFLIIFCIARGKLLPPRSSWPWIAVTGILMMCINHLIVQNCTALIGAGMTALLNYMQSVFVCILAIVFLRERFTVYKAIGIACCIAGLMILLNVDVTENVWAIFLGLSSAVVWAVSNIIFKLKLQGQDMIQCTAWQMACGSVVLLLYLTVFAPEALRDGMIALSDASSSGYFGVLLLLYNGIIASAFAFLLWNSILKSMEAGKASIAVMAVPAVGVISGVIILHEPMSWSIAIGMILILGGVLTVLTKGRG